MPRVEGLRLPTYSKYFRKPTNITAAEHHAVQKVLPHLVHGLVDDQLTSMVAQACQLAMRITCRRTKECYTDADLDRIDSVIQELQDTLDELYGDDVSRNKPKFHKLSHLTGDMRDLGHPKNYNSDMFEADHVHDKAAYEMTSRRQQNQQYVGEVVNNLRLQDMFKALSIASEQAPGSVSQHYVTALMRAFRDSQHSFSSSYSIIDLLILQDGQAAAHSAVNQKLAQRSVDLLRHCQELQHLRHRLREFVLGEQLGYGAAYRATNLPQLPSNLTIRVQNSAVLAADCPWDEESFLLQTIRATPNFHSRPFYDVVAVWQAADDEQEAAADTGSRGRGRGRGRASRRRAASGRRRGNQGASSSSTAAPQRVVAYAKLLLLFGADLPGAGPAQASQQYQLAASAAGGMAAAQQGRDTSVRQLAYVQWYRVVESDDPLRLAGAVALKWDTVRDPARDGALTPRCGIVDLSSIIRREYIVQDYACAAGARFHVSPFNY